MNNIRPSSRVQWVVETDGILLLHEAGTTLKLPYPKAAIWDFLTRGDTNRQIAHKVSAIASLKITAAMRLTEETIEELRRGEFLVPEERHG
jgi:hypothetical protein